jgi:serine phosphatase RsbU (regulator of sigma subunit)
MVIADVRRRFEIGLASRSFPGEPVSGDHFLTKFSLDGALFAVIDGAGHGIEASLAAHAAETVLSNSSERSPAKLLSRCHEAIRSTRGAAISLAVVQLSDCSMSWGGVGNVDGTFLRLDTIDTRWKREALLLRNGVVGYEFSVPRLSTFPIADGDLLIFTTDGIKPFFLDGIALDGHAQSIADSILQMHGKETDDALVMAVRMRGERDEGE